MPDAPSTCKTGVLIFCLGEKGVEGRFFNFIELNQSHHDLIEVLGTYLKIFQLFLTYFNFIIHNNKRSRIKTSAKLLKKKRCSKSGMSRKQLPHSMAQEV